jgi:hypothetical protein
MFEQATIPIQKQREFQQLQAAIDAVFSAPVVEKFLGTVKSKGLQIRNYEGVLAAGLIEKAYPSLGAASKSLYEGLALTDQGQMREFYLERLESVPVELRTKFNSIYRSVT